VAEQNPSFFARLFLAFAAFFRVLFDAAFAGGVARLKRGDTPRPQASAPPDLARAPEGALRPPKLREVPVDSALQLLGLLQREGRLIDFLQEDVASYSDADIGAAARVVHDGVKKALGTHVTLERVRGESEGSRITLARGFSASEVRLVGNVVGEPPFSGTLNHAGWRVTQIELPKLSDGHDLKIIAPAEVEL
jgi:hypothetical protein